MLALKKSVLLILALKKKCYADSPPSLYAIIFQVHSIPGAKLENWMVMSGTSTHRRGLASTSGETEDQQDHINDADADAAKKR